MSLVECFKLIKRLQLTYIMVIYCADKTHQGTDKVCSCQYAMIKSFVVIEKKK